MTRHFSLAELVASDTATRQGINNAPPEEVIPNLERLMRTLEVVRTAVGDRPVIVTSGYRCERLNRHIGGSATSAHMDGRAADIKVVGLTPFEVAEKIRSAGLILDQLIYEGHWVHVGIAKDGQPPRGQVLTAKFKDGRATYLQGVHA